MSRTNKTRIERISSKGDDEANEEGLLTCRFEKKKKRQIQKPLPCMEMLVISFLIDSPLLPRQVLAITLG